MNKTTVIDIQIRGPDTPAGGFAQLGTILRNGTRVYVIGNNDVKTFKLFTVPRRCESRG
jgi:hypothetical protein